MKKHITAKKPHQGLTKNEIKQFVATGGRLTVGVDLGDKTSHYCILDEAANVLSSGQLPTTQVGMSSLFGKMPSSRVALEVGTHSPWISRLLAGLGHEVIVANAHEVKLITQSKRKTDRIDAEKLARLARIDPQLRAPIRHRGAEAQADLAVIRARAALVKARTGLINCARGLVKPMGERLPSCDADGVKEGLAEKLSERTRAVIVPLLKSVEEISRQIGEYDDRMGEIAKRYPEVELLKQVYGVGTLIALTFILTLEDAQRFRHSRDVGPYLGLTRRQRDSGEKESELGISKAGDKLLRELLVQAAHCILRRGAPDSDLRAWGLEKLEKGEKKGSSRRKRKIVVGVARKLAVVLHRLWVTGEVYDPLYNRKAVAVRAVAA